MRHSRVRCRLWVCQAGLRVCLLLAGSVSASAQTYAQQDGRLFDANPSLYGGRINQPRPVSPLMVGNRLTTGNVRFGMSLRSFSPISDPTNFTASLGSASLSAFRRDAFSVADSPLGLRPIGGIVPYYDPARTAPTGSFLRRRGGYQYDIPQFRPGIGGQGGALPGQLNYAAPLSGQPPVGLVMPGGAGSAASLGGPLSSTLFGVRTPQMPGSALEQFDATARFQPPSFPDTGLPFTPDLTARAVTRFGEERRREGLAQGSAVGALPAPSPLEVEPNPLERILEGDSIGVLSQRAARIVEPQVESPAGAGAAGAGRSVFPLPGDDLFTDLRMALELEKNPNAEWFRELYEAMRTDPSRAQEIQQDVALEAQQFVARLERLAIRSFAGRAATPLNTELREAEALMQVGRYYQAAQHYDRAAQVAPGNPLPLVGRAHALLAAGEYRSAAVALLQALGRFPDLARFRFDLESLMGSGEIVDVRRAELMRLLERNEDVQLRFLLGYLEVYSGYRAQGLENLRRAASQAEYGSIIWRYPRLLQQEGTATAPALRPTAAVSEGGE